MPKHDIDKDTFDTLVNQKKRDKANLWLILLLISLFMIFLLWLANQVIGFAEHFEWQNKWLKYTFYGFVVFVIVVGIIYPIIRVFFAPVFSLNRLHDKKGRAKLRWCHRLVRNVVQNCDLTEEEKFEIRQCFINKKDDIDDAIIEFFRKNIAPKIYSEAFTTAKNVFIITAVSQKSFIDMIATATAHFSLVKRIVEICGFRPTMPKLIQLYTKVTVFSLIAGTLEEADLEDMIPSLTGTVIGNVGGLLLASLVQGAANAYTTLRVAMITKHLLLDSEFSSKKQIVQNASKDAHKMLNEVLVSLPKAGVISLWDKIKHAVTKPFAKKDKSQSDYAEEVQSLIKKKA